MTPAGNEPATFRFMVQHLNQCATAVPLLIRTLHSYKPINTHRFNLSAADRRRASGYLQSATPGVRARLKRDGTRSETRFCLSAKRTSPFKSAGASVQSTTGSRGVRISGSNAGYTMFRGRVQDYWLPTPFTCFPFTSPTVRHRVPSGFNWTLETAAEL